MDTEHDRLSLFTRRALVLGGGQLALFGALGARMYYLQVTEAAKYETLAEENRINMRLMVPPRGRILDRNGLELATNRLNYRITVIPEQTEDMTDTLARLAKLMPLSDERIAEVLKRASRSRDFLPVLVAENVSWESFARVNANLTELPGVQPDAGHTRLYTQPQIFAHPVGYVQAVSEEDVAADDDPLLMLPDFRIGKVGIETVFEPKLRGSAGARRVEVNALGREIRELTRNDGDPGADVSLAVDAELQTLAAEKLDGQSGAIVVMDIWSGELVALASWPGFDPNEFTFGISHDSWNALRDSRYKPLMNKATMGQYPPGSTFKMVSAMAALEKGVVTPEEKIQCNGKMTLGNATFHCWKKHGHGPVNMKQALEQSCDTYFYKIAERLDIEDITHFAKQFGLGSRVSLELDAQAGGLMPDDAWKRRAIGVPWQKGETLIAAIGQGYLLSTPLQLAVMTARIANGGYAVEPTLIKRGPGVARDWPRMDVPGRSLQLAQEGMVAVTMGKRGTARASKITEEGLSMAGKTGTAQVKRITLAEREAGLLEDNEKPWEHRDHALFVGYGPIEAPRYAVAVVVEHGGGGSTTAAPIARDMLLATMRKDPTGRMAALVTDEESS